MNFNPIGIPIPQHLRIRKRVTTFGKLKMKSYVVRVENGVPVRRATWLDTSNYPGYRLKQIRAINGVGRPPKESPNLKLMKSRIIDVILGKVKM